MELRELKRVETSFYDFIGNEKDVIIRLHNTATEENGIKIIEQGFRYVSSLDYTTDSLSYNIKEEIDYFIVKRKFYGNFTVVLHLGIDLMEKYLHKVRSKGISEHKELIFSHITEEINEDDHQINILHRQFIKGFYDYKKNVGYLSPYFDPHHDNPEFELKFQELVLKYGEQ